MNLRTHFFRPTECTGRCCRHFRALYFALIQFVLGRLAAFLGIALTLFLNSASANVFHEPAYLSTWDMDEDGTNDLALSVSGRSVDWTGTGYEYQSFVYLIQFLDGLIRWFEESPNVPAIAGRYPAPQPQVRSSMVNSQAALEFEIANAREPFHLEGRLASGKSPWRLYYTNAPARFTIPMPLDDRPRLFRLVSAD